MLGSPEVAIVDPGVRAGAASDSPNPVGTTFEVEQRPGEPRRIYEIVGLVKDVKYGELREEFAPIAYLASAQEEAPGPFVSLLVRSDAPLRGR